jgi:hypothetical protein
MHLHGIELPVTKARIETNSIMEIVSSVACSGGKTPRLCVMRELVRHGEASCCFPAPITWRAVRKLPAKVSSRPAWGNVTAAHPRNTFARMRHLALYASTAYPVHHLLSSRHPRPQRVCVHPAVGTTAVVSNVGASITVLTV